MGITFRSGDYVRHVRLGGRTIKDGEAAAIWNRRGEHTQIIGPRRVWMFSSDIRFLTRFKAEADQFLRITHRDGRVEHVTGPTSIYQNPAFHDEVKVHDGIRLKSSSECLMVYKNGATDATLEGIYNVAEQKAAPGKDVKDVFEGVGSEGSRHGRRLIKGPTLFVPEPNDSIHSFSWSLCSGREENVPCGNQKHSFQVLQCSNRSWFVELRVPTVDGFAVMVDLSIKYHVSSLDKLLLIGDPILNMHYGLKADVQYLGSKLTSESLRASSPQNTSYSQQDNEEDHIKNTKEDTDEKRILCGRESLASQLTDIGTLRQLKQAAESCGLQIDSITVSGITFCKELQKQVDEEQRLSESVRSEYAQKTERRKIHQIEVEDQRKSIEGEIELGRMKTMMQEKLDEDSYQIKIAALERKIALEKKEIEAQEELVKMKNESVLSFLKELQEMKVDLTTFLVGSGSKVSGKAKETANEPSKDMLERIDMMKRALLSEA